MNQREAAAYEALERAEKLMACGMTQAAYDEACKAGEHGGRLGERLHTVRDRCILRGAKPWGTR